jgi:hypothetical protein
LLLFLAVFGLQSALAQGKIRFQESSKYLGNVNEENGKVEAIFPFTNIGNSPVALQSVKTSCGCTTPVYTRDSVPPGSQGFVKVVFNPLGRPGSFKKQVVVNSSGASKIHTLHISGRVIPRPKGPRDFYPFSDGNLRFRTNHFTFGRLYKDEQSTLETIIYNEGDKPVRFNRGRSIIPDHLYPAMSRGKLMPGDTVHLKLTYKAGEKDDWGFCFDNFFLATDDRERPMKRFNVSVDLLERFPRSNAERAKLGRLKLDKAVHDFGKVTEGDTTVAIFRMTNIGKGDLHIRKVSSGCSCIEIELEETVIPPGESREMRVQFDNRGRVGREEKDLVLLCNDPNMPQRILKISANISRPE